jgi:hypothetical protein
MAARLLTTASTVFCPHGATAVLSTQNARVSAGARVLLASDIHQVVGCGFVTGGERSPCMTIEWKAGARAASIGGTAPLLSSSVGVCKNDKGLDQGVAIVAATQPKVSAR